jgi:putative transposase
VRDHQAIFPVAALCRVLQVSHSGFYAWLKRPASERARRDALLVPQIVASHGRSDNTYGAPRILGDLREAGERLGRKRVARLMRAAGIRGVSRRRFVITTKRSETQGAAPDLVERKFIADRPNTLWVADITYVPTWAGFLFLAIVLDAFSRRIVGWAMATHLKTELVLDALEMALTQRKPDGVIHHSDHGCQYTSICIRKAVRRNGCEAIDGFSR